MNAVRDEENLELPPLDGEDSETGGDEFDDPIDALDDDGDDPYDDKNADDPEMDDALPLLESESVLDDDGANIEIEAPVLLERITEMAATRDDEVGGLEDDDFDFREVNENAHADRGEEGFVEPEAPLDEADSPPLDADEEGEGHDALFFEDEREIPGDELVFSERAWTLKAKAALGDVVNVAVAGARVDARVAGGAALRSVDGGASFATSDLPPTSLPSPRGTSLRLPGERTVSIRSGFDRCLVVCERDGQAPRIVCDLSIELDADASDVTVHALAYDVGTTTLWIGCRWGVVGLEVPRDDIKGSVS
ncbi:hypothetical protein BH09MYX1_BH09MYX1_59580 [soil metagenome]